MSALGIVLVAVLVAVCCGGHLLALAARRKERHMESRNEWTFELDGMKSDACARTIDEAVRDVRGVVESATEYAAGRGRGRARVVAEAAVDGTAIIAAIEGKGYRVLGKRSASLGAGPYVPRRGCC